MLDEFVSQNLNLTGEVYDVALLSYSPRILEIGQTTQSRIITVRLQETRLAAE